MRRCVKGLFSMQEIGLMGVPVCADASFFRCIRCIMFEHLIALQPRCSSLCIFEFEKNDQTHAIVPKQHPGVYLDLSNSTLIAAMVVQRNLRFYDFCN